MAAATMLMYEYESDLRNTEHYLGSSENKASEKRKIQARTEFELMHIHFFLCSSHIWFSYIYSHLSSPYSNTLNQTLRSWE